MSVNTKFAKQSIMGNLPKVGETHALSKPVTSNSNPTPLELKVMKNDKKDVNSDSNGLSSKGIDNTKTRRPQPRSNTKNDRVPSTSMSSYNKNKGVEVEEHHKNLLLSKNKKHMSSVSNNIKLDSQNVISKVVCVMCKIIASSESKSQSDCSNGDNACASNHLEPKITRFPNSTSLLGRVYFIEGLGHNLFLIGQFCDSDLEVAFRSACFVRNIEGVDLLRGDRTTNLYTINLHEMSSASPICLMARASSTKKPDISFLHVFGALCYPKNDHEDIGKVGAKGELDLLFEAMYDDFIGGQTSAAQRTVPAAQVQQVRQTSTTSTSIADSAPTPTNSSTHATNFPITSQDVDELNSQ
nr:integrase, catalytic region, zinc finger, CCHC-type, peptidase aspartic, catalytic [Tanacetum cinerariifolium]